MKYFMKRLVSLLLIAAAIYGAWPYYTAWRLHTALRESDTVALDTYVDWPAVRSGIKYDLNAALTRTATETTPGDGAADKITSGLMSVLGFTVGGTMVEFLATPRGLSTLILTGDIGTKAAESPRQILGEKTREKKSAISRVKFAFFVDPSTFKIELRDKDPSKDETLTLLFRLQNFRWKLARIYLPILNPA